MVSNKDDQKKIDGLDTLPVEGSVKEIKVPKVTVTFKLNDGNNVIFPKADKKNLPISISTGHFADITVMFNANLPAIAADQTSLRLTDTLLWNMELIKRSSKNLFVEKAISKKFTYARIIESSLTLAIHNSGLIKSTTYHDENPKDLDRVIKSLTRVIYYDGGLSEFYIPYATHDDSCFIFSLINLYLVDNSLVSEKELELLKWITSNRRFGQFNKKDSLQQTLIDSEIDYNEIYNFFGYPEEFSNKSVNSFVDKILPKILPKSFDDESFMEYRFNKSKLRDAELNMEVRPSYLKTRMFKKYSSIFGHFDFS